GQIERAVTVEIRSQQINRARAYADLLCPRRAEVSARVGESYDHRACRAAERPACEGQICIAVFIEVAQLNRRDRAREIEERIEPARHPKAAPSTAERNLEAEIVGDNQIRFAVSIEIAYIQRGREERRFEDIGSLKSGAVRVEQDRDCVGVMSRRRQINLAVA